MNHFEGSLPIKWLTLPGNSSNPVTLGAGLAPTSCILIKACCGEPTARITSEAVNCRL